MRFDLVNRGGKLCLEIDNVYFPPLDRAGLEWVQHLLLQAVETKGVFDKTVFDIRVQRSGAEMVTLSIGARHRVHLLPKECVNLASAIDAKKAGAAPKGKAEPVTNHSSNFINEAIASAIKMMASVGPESDRKRLRERAVASDLSDWRTMTVAKVTGVGVLTGLAPGPVGILIEGLDIAYLLAASGQACYGIGHILEREVDYDRDIPLILAIWAGAGEAAAVGGIGKVGIKVGGKAAVVLGTQAAAKVGGKILAKVSGKAAAKLTAKMGAKAASGFMPVVGAFVSGGINYWVATSLMDAAEKYYRSGYVNLDGTEAEWIAESVEDGVEVVSALWSHEET